MLILPPKFYKNNDGVTLLLTIIILSAMLAISFSIATILFTEIRSSGDLLRTEAAFYGGQGQVEEALYKVKRGIPTGSFTYSSQVGNITLSSPQENTVSDPIIEDKIPTNTSFSTATHYVFPSADPNDTSAGSQYSKVKLTYINTGNTTPLTVYVCQFDPTKHVDPSGQDPNSYRSAPCTDPGNNNTPYWITSPYASVNPGESPEWTFNTSLQQELIIYNSGSNGTIYIQLQPYDASGNPKGLPYFAQSSVDVYAGNGSVSRKIRAIIPNSGGTSTGNTTQTQTVTEGGTASLTCASGTIKSFTSQYGKNCAGTCPVSCGTCNTSGGTSCSVTYNNANCGDCNAGCSKNGDLSITCGP